MLIGDEGKIMGSKLTSLAGRHSVRTGELFPFIVPVEGRTLIEDRLEVLRETLLPLPPPAADAALFLKPPPLPLRAAGETGPLTSTLIVELKSSAG